MFLLHRRYINWPCEHACVYFSAGIVQLNVNNSEYPTLCLQQLDSRFYNVMSVNYLQCVL